MTATYIYDAVRTPFGRGGGALSGIRPDDLAAVAMRAAVERTGIDPARIDDVIFGDANQAGEDNRNVARMGALLAGFPSSVSGVTVNRLCASAVEAVIQGSRAIESGDADLILAGGVESMSRAPFVVEKSPKPWPAVGNQTLWNTSIGWRMTNPALREGLDDLQRRVRREARAALRHLARGAGRVRAAQPPARRRGLGGRRVRRRDRAGARCRARARRGHPCRHDAREARRAEGAVRRGRHRDRGQLVVDQRRRLGRAARTARACWMPSRSPASPAAACSATTLMCSGSPRSRRRTGRSRAPAAPGPMSTSSSSTRPSPRRASRACSCGPTSTPSGSTSTAARSRSAIRSAHPAAGSSATRRTSSTRRGGGVAVAAICIGVGQGLAVVLER